MKLPDPVVKPTHRRIRVRLGSAVVADTQRAQLLVQYGPGGLPTYFVPLADIRPDVLVDERADEDGRRRWTVASGRARADGAAWTHPNPVGMFAPLEGHVTFSWRQLEWFEEDERALVHARDPYKRVDTLRSSRRVEVAVNGEPIANSVRPLLLFETSLPIRYYLPFEDVRRDLFVPSDLITMCPYKGTARYWSIRINNELVPDIAWSYPDPIPENPKIKDLVCFFNERVDLSIDGVAQEPVETPWSKPPAATIDGVPTE